MNHRRSVDNCKRCQNRGIDITPGRVRQKAEFQSGDIRHRGGVTIVQALMWNWGSCRSDVKGAFEWRTHKNQSTDAEHGDGVMHSSTEDIVMVLE